MTHDLGLEAARVLPPLFNEGWIVVIMLQHILIVEAKGLCGTSIFHVRSIQLEVVYTYCGHFAGNFPHIFRMVEIIKAPPIRVIQKSVEGFYVTLRNQRGYVIYHLTVCFSKVRGGVLTQPQRTSKVMTFYTSREGRSNTLYLRWVGCSKMTSLPPVSRMEAAKSPWRGFYRNSKCGEAL